MKKKFILLIIGLFLLLSTTSVKAESKICEYKDNNVNVKVTIENNNISYSFFEYKTDGAVVEEKASESVVDIRDFEPDCASEIYYKKTDNGNNRIYNFYSNSLYSNFTPLKIVVKNTSTESDDNNTGTTISTNFFGTLDVVKCGNAEIPAPIPPIVRTIINLIKIATPFVLIIIGMIDMLKAVIANDEKKIKEAQISFTKRLIPATLVFLTVTIIQFLVGIIADDSESITNCINCMISNADSCIKINKPTNSPSDDSEYPTPGSTSSSYVSSIKNDGVIVTINAKNVTGIKGYYFSYDSNRPKNKTDGYLATNKSTIDVVRLPGKTYVWVEDSNGKISKAKTITISNDVILNTLNKKNKYKSLNGISLEKYLKDHGWSVEEFSKLIARSVRASGIGKKQSAATAAVSLQTVLAQKYGIKIPYFGQRYSNFGANPKWGTSRGLDCSGFITWTFWQAGIKYDALTGKIIHPSYWHGWKKIKFSSSEGEIGDILVTQSNESGRHVKLIVGRTEDSFIIIESTTSANGVIATTYSFKNREGYLIEKGELFNTYKYYSVYTDEEYPSGF